MEILLSPFFRADNFQEYDVFEVDSDMNYFVLNELEEEIVIDEDTVDWVYHYVVREAGRYARVGEDAFDVDIPYTNLYTDYFY